MKNCIQKNPPRTGNFCSNYLKAILLLSVAILSIISFFGTLGGICKVYPEKNGYSHSYLAKLRYLPTFNEADPWFWQDKPWQVTLYGNIFQEDNLDILLRNNYAKIDDLYPEHNEGELGRWVIIKSSRELLYTLYEDLADIEIVEDNSNMFSIQNEDEGFLAYVNSTINTVKNDKTWGLRLPMVKEGLSALKPVRKVVVAVVDTGIDLKHPALKNNLVQGKNFAGGDVNDPSNRDPNEMHATHVSGTIVAKPSPDGFQGIAESVAVVMPVRVLDESGSGSTMSVSRGVVFAADNGAHVINMSLGSRQYSASLHDAVKYAVNKKSVSVVCAKGNSNTNRPNYPSDYPEAIGVTATSLRNDGAEERAYFSNYGPNSTCSAPGHYIYSTLPGNKYGFASGTSMACPHAAGSAAVILSQGVFTPEQIKNIMETAGDNLNTDKPIGKRINVRNFVERSKHNIMSVSETIAHPYGKCCINAGIVARMNSYDNGKEIVTSYEDSDGIYRETREPYPDNEAAFMEIETDVFFIEFQKIVSEILNNNLLNYSAILSAKSECPPYEKVERNRQWHNGRHALRVIPPLD